MDISEISNILNRKYPMLLLDGVTHVEPGVKCHAYKNLSYNEWFFPEHFPKEPIMPGTLQIEAFTQAVAIPLLLVQKKYNTNGVPILLSGIDKIRFYKSVIPGDRFEIKANIERISMGFATASVIGSVNNETVSNCKITYKTLGKN